MRGPLQAVWRYPFDAGPYSDLGMHLLRHLSVSADLVDLRFRKREAILLAGLVAELSKALFSEVNAPAALSALCH